MHADVAPKTVYRWLERGVVAKTRDGQLDYAAADAARGGGTAPHTSPPAAGPGLSDDDFSAVLSYSQAQARNETAKAHINELKAKQLARELVHVDTVRLFVAEVVRTFRSRIDGLPDRLAGELAAQTDEHAVRTAMARECTTALNELAAALERLATGAGADREEAA